LEKRRKKRRKFGIQETEVQKLAEMAKSGNGWQVQNPKKLLEKLKHQAQKGWDRIFNTTYLTKIVF